MGCWRGIQRRNLKCLSTWNAREQTTSSWWSSENHAMCLKLGSHVAIICHIGSEWVFDTSVWQSGFVGSQDPQLRAKLRHHLNGTWCCDAIRLLKLEENGWLMTGSWGKGWVDDWRPTSCLANWCWCRSISGQHETQKCRSNCSVLFMKHGTKGPNGFYQNQRALHTSWSGNPCDQTRKVISSVRKLVFHQDHIFKIFTHSDMNQFDWESSNSKFCIPMYSTFCNRTGPPKNMMSLRSCSTVSVLRPRTGSLTCYTLGPKRQGVGEPRESGWVEISSGNLGNFKTHQKNIRNIYYFEPWHVSFESWKQRKEKWDTTNEWSSTF